jgi:uridine phosphorylase
MLSVVLEPRREAGEPLLPASGLFLLNPADIPHARENAADWRRHYLFHSNLALSPQEDRFWCGPALGAPMAVICLEKIIALGARRILVFGWCGSLCPEVAVGDVVLPSGALSEEGTSAHYPVPGAVRPSLPLQARLRDALAAEYRLHQGPVWTTDALYRESRDKVARYAGQGLLAVEMEFAALARVAAFRGVELAAALLVSDLAWQQPWQPAFRGKDFRRRARELVARLFALLAQGD